MITAFRFRSILQTKNDAAFALCRSFRVGTALNNQSFYEILQIPPNSTQSEIKDAYYKLSKMYHPDVRKDETSLTMFQKITEAYDILGNVRTRLEYDNKVFGKYQPFDTSKKEYYPSVQRDQQRDIICAPDVKQVLDTKPLIDRYIQDEYRERLVDYQIATKKGYYPNYWGEYGYERNVFCILIMACLTGYKFLESKYGWSYF